VVIRKPVALEAWFDLRKVAVVASIPRRAGWVDWVRMALSQKELERLKWCVQRGAPLGEETWVEATARQFAWRLACDHAEDPKSSRLVPIVQTFISRHHTIALPGPDGKLNRMIS